MMVMENEDREPPRPKGWSSSICLVLFGVVLGVLVSIPLDVKSRYFTDSLVVSDSFDGPGTPGSPKGQPQEQDLQKVCQKFLSAKNASKEAGKSESEAEPSHGHDETKLWPEQPQHVEEEGEKEKIARFASALSVIDSEKTKIRQLYQLEHADIKRSLWTPLSTSMHIVHRLQAALANTGGTFAVAFTGMSVCAGHGSYFNESYPLVFEQSLAQSFKKAGLRLRVRNACMGGTYTFPYSWCLSNIAGTDVDVITWDFGMMEAGRPMLSEGWLRQVMHMPSKPAVVFMGGYANELLEDQTGGAITDEPGFDRVDRERFELAKKYNKESKLPVSGFWVAPALKAKYKQVKIEEKNRGKTPDGIENFIDILPIDSRKETPEALKNLRWYSKTGLPGQASWHPAPREHAVIGRLFAYHYLILLESALHNEIDRLRTGYPAPQTKAELTAEIQFSGSSAACSEHEEMFCDSEFQCASSYEPRQGRGVVDLLENDNFKKALAPADNTAIRDVIRLKTGYLDRKYAYKGKMADGPAGFRLHHVKDGKVIVCEPTYGWNKPEDVADLESDIEYRIDSKVVEIVKTIDIKEIAKNCVVVTTNCPRGGHDLSLRLLTSTKSLYVSFVIWT